METNNRVSSEGSNTKKQYKPGIFTRVKYLLGRIRAMNWQALFACAHTVQKRTGRLFVFILADILFCGARHGAGYMDYLVFEMYNLNEAQRATYITRSRNNRFVRLLNPREHWPVLEDKGTFLSRFAAFAGRGWLDLRTASPEAFASFCEKHPNIVAKPISGTCGHGITFINTATTSLNELYLSLIQQGKLLVEEPISQHPALQAICPQSVNTLRLVTLRGSGREQLVFSSIRIGNGLAVDNLNSGGMAALIDPANGVISTPGADKKGNFYAQHPGTGTTLQGTAIPFFRQAVDMVLNAAKQLPELGYVAWDVAVTPSGPLLVEANHFPGHDIYQFSAHLPADKTGLLPRFEQALNGKAQTTNTIQPNSSQPLLVKGSSSTGSACL